MPIGPRDAIVEALRAMQRGESDASDMPIYEPGTMGRIVEQPVQYGGAGNENPMLNPPRGGGPRDLPPDYQIERRPYRGAEVPQEEFERAERERYENSPEGQKQREIALALQAQNEQLRMMARTPRHAADFQRQFRELREIDPRMADRFYTYGLKGPGGDSDMEHVYGPGTVGREMGHGSPFIGDAGMLPESGARSSGRYREPVFPLNRRFGPLYDREDQYRADAQDAARSREDDTQTLREDLESIGIDPEKYLQDLLR